MEPLLTNEFTAIVKASGISTRLRRELRYNPESINDWSSFEYLAVTTRSPFEGVLIFAHASGYAAVAFELSLRVVDAQSGRSKPIICDFCFTWQSGQKAAHITFIQAKTKRTRSFLCCGDLGCSNHIRGLTQAAANSRAQLPEDMDVSQRIVRLKRRLEQLAETLELTYIKVS